MKAKVKIGVRRYTFQCLLCKCRIYQSRSIREIFCASARPAKLCEVGQIGLKNAVIKPVAAPMRVSEVLANTT